MNKTLERALRAVARMKGDGEVSAADLKKVLAVALGRWLDADGDDDADDRNERPH